MVSGLASRKTAIGRPPNCANCVREMSVVPGTSRCGLHPDVTGPGPPRFRHAALQLQAVTTNHYLPLSASTAWPSPSFVRIPPSGKLCGASPYAEGAPSRR